MHGPDYGFRRAMDDDLGNLVRISAPLFKENEDFTAYKRKIINYLPAVNPIFPHLFDEPPPQDVASSGSCHHVVDMDLMVKRPISDIQTFPMRRRSSRPSVPMVLSRGNIVNYNIVARRPLSDIVSFTMSVKHVA
jgi:hypothetical protein